MATAVVRTAMQALHADLTAFRAKLEGPLSDLPARRGEILAEVHGYTSELADLLARAATFALPQSGWGFVYDFLGRAFAGILRQTADIAVRWDRRLVEFDEAIAAHDALPAAASHEERFR